MFRSFRSLVLRRLAGAAVIALALGGCWATESATVAIVPGASEPASANPAPFRRSSLERSRLLLVATTRRPADDPSHAPFFGSERGRGLAFAEARLAGPDRSFVGRVSSAINGDWGVAEVAKLESGSGAAQAFAQAALGRDVLIYVHGYRETFQSAAVSAARLSDGVQFTGASALFTWPSANGTFDYGYDRESALWSRDAFGDLITALAKSPSGGRIHIVAHSMGTLLTLETLRMVRASGGEAAMAKIGSVTLAAPDIDLDLFTGSVERLGPDARKITVISAKNDRALALSSRLAGGVTRAGAADRERLEALGVRVADASDYGGGLVNHDLFLTNKDVQQVVKRAIERERG